jgi:hypothetical protein
MNEQTMLKQTLVLTGKLVGIFTLWVALVSVVAVAVTDRVVLSLAGGAPSSSVAAPDGANPKTETTPARGKNPSAIATKPNG